MSIYIKGNYRKSIYQNESGYIIGLFKVKETNDELLSEYINHTITFTGYFHEINEVDIYIFNGTLINHDKYGEQFQVTSYERVLPVEKDGIVEFLSSGLFKGIGDKKAKLIVDVLKENTLKIILTSPSNLLLIPTITKKQVDILHTTLLNYESSYSLIVELNNMGFNTRESMYLYKKYKTEVLNILNENIYQVIENNELVFKRVDFLALNSDYKRDDIRRIKASVLYILKELTEKDGHSYYSLNEIYSYIFNVLSVIIDENLFKNAIDSLIKDVELIVSENRYYLRSIYDAENNITNRISYLVKKPDNLDKNLDNKIDQLQSYNSIFYNNDQLLAIKESFSKNCLIITGGPGVGKTTIIKGIVDLYRLSSNLRQEKLVEKIALLAPTGRASKRISESTLFPAVTIHRFLKWNKDNDSFSVNEYNKSEVEFVIIDEASMIDINLFDSLLKGLSFDTKIILVGDFNQLPSVGPGQVLKDLIESSKVPIVKLNELYRQEKDSNIINLAYQINNNSIDEKIFYNKEDLVFIPCKGDTIINNIIDIAKTYKDYDLKKIQILAPMYKGINGIDNLNKQLQLVFNDKTSKKISINNTNYLLNDKVIQLTNMPDDNVFNGDIGFISNIVDNTKKEVYIDFDLSEVKYTVSNFNKFKLAYSISIHKSQGSEFDIVIIPICSSFNRMLYRKLIYTAITRSKKKIYLVGEYDAFLRAVANNEDNLRRTSLKEKLILSIK